MDITLEQARVLEAVVRAGTVSKAASELNRGHSAVLYAVKNLEEQTGVQLFNRTGHRNALTAAGEIVLKHCKALLAAKQDLEAACKQITQGWEPTLKVIYDEVVDFDFMAEAVASLKKMNTATEIKILSAHLHEVETLFNLENADMMVTVLPFPKLGIPSKTLHPIQMKLVAHRTHPLSKAKNKLSNQELNQHTFVAIKPASQTAGLSTEQMDFASYFYLNGFVAKKQAILKKLGFGWLPDYLIGHELQNGILKILNCEIANSHTLHPCLYHRPANALGLTAKRFLKVLTGKI